jgi:ABC-type phosphate transport system substrate-binding protein
MKTLTTLMFLAAVLFVTGCATSTASSTPLAREGLRAELSTTVKPLPAVGSPLP